MKKILLLATSLLFAFLVKAQVSKTVNISAGGLSAALTTAEFTSITNLTITGSIDARDFKCMRDGIINLAVLDISAAKIETYSGNGGTSTYTSYPANEIPAESFYNCKHPTNITIGNSVTSIGNKAFSHCTNLTSISFGNSVSFIGDYAFFYCENLTSITIGNSVTSIGNYAFSYCTKLTNITIGNSVTSIGDYAFNHCTGLTSITIGNSVTSIGDRAFLLCYNLTSITLGNSVKSIGDDAFNGCFRLTSITIGNSVTSIGNYAFSYCSNLTSVTIGNSVTSIGIEAFSYCYNLTSITIGNSVTSIGDRAFCCCTGLTSLYVNAISPVVLSSDVFTSVNVYVCSLYVPVGSKTAYQAASGWGDFINITEMPFTSLTNQIEKVLNIYPNPVTDGFCIDGLDAASILILTDLGGKIVLTKQVIANEYVNINFLPKGVYIAKITTPKGLIEKKIIKD